jgi:hypothetical protein
MRTRPKLRQSSLRVTGKVPGRASLWVVETEEPMKSKKPVQKGKIASAPAKAAASEELSEAQLENVAGGACRKAGGVQQDASATGTPAPDVSMTYQKIEW